MKELHLPWLELAIFFPLAASLLVCRMKDPHRARHWALLASGLAFVCTLCLWEDFHLLSAKEADDPGHLMARIFGHEIFVLDQLSAPLLPLAALLHFLTTATTVRTKIRRFSFGGALFSEAVLLATFSCKDPWGIIVLLSLATLPPFLELRARGKSSRVFALHMGLFIALMAIGWHFVGLEGGVARVHSWKAIVPLMGAIFIRSGIVPAHCWMADLFENATFGTALLYSAPIPGAYAAVRLLLPIAPDWGLQGVGQVSLFTAVYAAAMALVQNEARRFFCYLFLSHSALVLVGLEIVTPIGLTGGLCVWLSVGMALTGFGLTLRALEARRGHLLLTDYQGLYEHMPTLATFFALTGLASVGFPGTIGFVGTELLVDGAVETYPHIGVTVVIATALNGIAIVQAYFTLFTGTRHHSSVSLKAHVRERFAVLALALLILLGGLFPQPGVYSRFLASREILRDRRSPATGPAPVSEQASVPAGDGEIALEPEPHGAEPETEPPPATE